MKQQQQTRYAVCIDGTPYVVRKTREKANRSLQEFKEILIGGYSLTIEKVVPTIEGDFILFERVG